MQTKIYIFYDIDKKLANKQDLVILVYDKIQE